MGDTSDGWIPRTCVLFHMDGMEELWKGSEKGLTRVKVKVGIFGVIAGVVCMLLPGGVGRSKDCGSWHVIVHTSM